RGEADAAPLLLRPAQQARARLGARAPRRARRDADRRRALRARRSNRDHVHVRPHALRVAALPRLLRARRARLGALRRAARLLRRAGVRGPAAARSARRARHRALGHRRRRGRAQAQKKTSLTSSAISAAINTRPAIAANAIPSPLSASFVGISTGSPRPENADSSCCST